MVLLLLLFVVMVVVVVVAVVVLLLLLFLFLLRFGRPYSWGEGVRLRSQLLCLRSNRIPRERRFWWYRRLRYY